MRFELIDLCYVPGCDNPADTYRNAGPMCLEHAQRQRYSTEYTELVYEALYRSYRKVDGRAVLHTVDSANEWAKSVMWKKYGAAWL